MRQGEDAPISKCDSKFSSKKGGKENEPLVGNIRVSSSLHYPQNHYGSLKITDEQWERPFLHLNY